MSCARYCECRINKIATIVVGRTSNIEYFAQLVNDKTQNFAINSGGEVLVIYDNVKVACKERGLSVQELEKALGFSRSSIYKWNKHSPNIEKVKAVAEYLNKPIEYFLEEKEARKWK